MAEYKVIDTEQLDADLTSIAEAIRTKGNTSETLEFPEGFVSAISNISDDALGTFWDIFQNNGNRRNYQFGFSGTGWTDENFRPKYDIILIGYNAGMFRTCTNITDLYTTTVERGIQFDTSQATALNEGFASCTNLMRIPPINVSNATNISGMCISCRNLITIDKLTVTENVKWTTTVFQDCEKLENLIIEGIIGQDGFDVHWSTNLSKTSIESIMTAITTTKAITVTFSKTAVDKAFETSEGANDGSTSTEWTTLVDTRPLSTIALT